MGQKDTYDEALIVEQLHHQETVNAAFGKVIEHYSQPLYWQIRRMVIDRLVFNMRYYDEMKYEDMSEILGTSVGALKASYHHAVKKIESFFGEEN